MCAICHPCSPCSELFNAAFVSCWMELMTAQKEDLVANLKLALSVPNIPEITQTLLNLAEFMEHCEEASVSGALTGWPLTEKLSLSGLLLSGLLQGGLFTE